MQVTDRDRDIRDEDLGSYSQVTRISASLPKYAPTASPPHLTI